MDQHPVPQHIASFEFKLFGNLTVRQFVTLAIPLTIAGIIYFSGIASVIRLPAAFILGAFGFFIALVPIGGRPFDKWFVSFIRAILSPTQRVWVKEKALPEFLQIVTAAPKKEEKVPQEITEQSKQRLMAYLRSLPKKEAKSSLDIREEMELSKLNEDLDKTGLLPSVVVWPTQAEVQVPIEPVILPKPKAFPKPEAFVESDHGQGLMLKPQAKPFMIDGVERKLRAQKLPQKEVLLYKGPVTHLASETNFAEEIVIPIKTADNQVRLVPGVGRTRVRKLHFAPPDGFDLSKLPVRGEKIFEISEELKKRFHLDSPRTVESLFKTELKQVDLPQAEGKLRKVGRGPKTLAAKPASSMPKLAPEQEPPSVDFANYQLKLTNRKVAEGAQPISGVSTGAAMIPLTNQPNIVSGVVIDSYNRPIEGAIMIVRDRKGVPLRAFKTNKIGQFLSVTPLPDGSYTVEVESQFCEFKPISLILKGKVVNPLEIKAQSSG